jgi:hypothetical protein
VAFRNWEKRPVFRSDVIPFHSLKRSLFVVRIIRNTQTTAWTIHSFFFFTERFVWPKTAQKPLLFQSAVSRGPCVLLGIWSCYVKQVSKTLSLSLQMYVSDNKTLLQVEVLLVNWRHNMVNTSFQINRLQLGDYYCRFYLSPCRTKNIARVHIWSVLTGLWRKRSSLNSAWDYSQCELLHCVAKKRMFSCYRRSYQMWWQNVWISEWTFLLNFSGKFPV